MSDTVSPASFGVSKAENSFGGMRNEGNSAYSSIAEKKCCQANNYKNGENIFNGIFQDRKRHTINDRKKEAIP
ncbi:hypothetical protein [Candidatus Kuenenia stuttgartiensis]|uniref:hypothetical protein n=1 Tax=Kuenenia stuttgartiensis TaxID=174633 RepID=UPI00146CF6EE|nr:hypothetical protein [Candidatus Kuenenia stuttgartiensis]